ncbi:MAG: hypothetical protein KAT65_18390, partial [Methanophagales archaeon]|nr:hypothetical protein [Methanophagales archaeon]
MMNLRMYKYAKENNIPLVMGGNNIGNSSFEQEHWKTGFLGVFPDNRGMYSRYDKIKLTLLLGFEYLRKSSNLHIPILKEYIGGASVYFFESLLKPKGVDTLGFYDYIYWNEEKVVATITKELDWKGASDATTTWRIDDAAYPLMNYMYYKLVGFTEHDEMYSKMIREGQISREEALERCLADHESRWIHGSRLLGLLEELEVSKEEVDEVLEGYKEELLKETLREKKL